MPLQPYNKRVILAFDTLDQPVRRDCVDRDTFSYLANRLMVRRVDVQFSAPADFVQESAARHLDYVAVVIAELLLLMR